MIVRQSIQIKCIKGTLYILHLKFSAFDAFLASNILPSLGFEHELNLTELNDTLILMIPDLINNSKW